MKKDFLAYLLYECCVLLGYWSISLVEHMMFDLKRRDIRRRGSLST